MMPHRSWFRIPGLALSLLLVTPATSQPAYAKDAFDKAGYEAAIARAEAGAADTDYLFLRQQAAIRYEYRFPTWEERDKAADALTSDPAQSLALATARIKVVWVDMIAHAVARTALRKLGRTQEADLQKSIVDSLIQSVMGGHSGKSAQDAFNAVTVDEEYSFLMLGGLKPDGQALSNTDGHTFDVMTVTDADDSTRKLTLWFNIDSFFGKEFE